MTNPPPPDDLVVMGRIAAPYAVRGWVKIQPYTEYLDSLADYPLWHLGKKGQWRSYAVEETKPHGHFLLAHLKGVDGRELAEAIVGSEVAVGKEELPEPEEDEYYWQDLIGLQVVNLQGDALGQVEGLLETGAHDVLRVLAERERLIPFVDAIVREVDLAGGRIVVDWGADY